MTFGSTFGRVLSPTFQPNSQAVAARWWDLDGTITSCVAAYQAEGAASYAASKVNLAKPGTYDAYEGYAPGWSAANGWTQSSNKYLITGVPIVEGMSMIVKFSGVEPLGGGALGGAFTGHYGVDNNRYYVMIGSGKHRYGYGNLGNQDGQYAQGSAIQALTPVGGYLNGILEKDLSTATWGSNPTSGNYFGIFARRRSDTNSFDDILPVGSIQAIAFYNTTLTIEQIAGVTVAMDSITIGTEPGSVILVFDDGRPDFYTNAFPLLTEFSAKATNYIISNRIDQANGMTTAQIQELYTAGIDIANHSHTHPNFSTLTQAEIEAELSACKTILDNNEWTRASMHHAYPYGAYDADTLAAMASLGFLTGRTTNLGKADIDYVYNNSQLHKLNIQYVFNSTSLSTVKSWVDTAKNKKTTYLILFHSILNDADTYSWSLANFEALLDYIQSTGITTETISEWYARYSAKYL